MNFDEQLKELKDKKLRYELAMSKLPTAKDTCYDLIKKEQELKEQLEKEEKDVKNLEKTSLASIVFDIIGKKEERLEKEQQEAYAARLKYNTVRAELDDINKEIEFLENELVICKSSFSQYDAIITKKAEALAAGNSDISAKIIDFENQISKFKKQLKETDEAVSAGSRALSCAEEINKSLNSANSWGTYDLIGGGTIATMAKHSYLDSAQDGINNLQTLLRKFNTELADVAVIANFDIQIDGFLRFADYFWDGFIADWSVLDKIHKSQERMDTVTEQINSVLSKLDSLKKSTESQLKLVYDEYKTLVENA